MTEDEAKTKWCPFARVGPMASASGCNRYSMENDAASAFPFARCIASACMAWRKPSYALPTTNDGFCGLAGTPQ